MRISYSPDERIFEAVSQIVNDLSLSYIDLDRIICIRSRGSRSKNTVARCHGLPRIWQKALKEKSTYIVEVISENFDQMSEEEKEKTLLHEILHIPKAFSGGFRSHSQYVTKQAVNKLYGDLQRIREHRRH